MYIYSNVIKIYICMYSYLLLTNVLALRLREDLQKASQGPDYDVVRLFHFENLQNHHGVLYDFFTIFCVKAARMRISVAGYLGRRLSLSPVSGGWVPMKLLTLPVPSQHSYSLVVPYLSLPLLVYHNLSECSSPS